MLEYKNITQVHIEVSSLCNAACPNCPRNVHGGYTIPGIDERAMTLGIFKNRIDESFVKQLDTVRFCGNYGDPITASDLPKIIEWLMEVNPTLNVQIHTNGGTRNKGWWIALAAAMNKNHRNTVIWSVDGLEDTNHLYRQKVVWQRVAENMTTYRACGGKSEWEFLRFEHNQHQIEEARQMAEALGFNSFLVKNPIGFNETGQMEVLDAEGKVSRSILQDNTSTEETQLQELLKSDYSDLMTVAKRAALEDQVTIDGYNKSINNQSRSIDCMTMREKEIYIASNGEVYPCCYLGHASQETLAINNIRFRQWIDDNVGFDNINLDNKSIEEIVNSDYFKLIQHTWSKSVGDGMIATCALMCNAECTTTRKIYGHD